MTFYNKEINELRTATNECGSEVPKILLKFIEGIGNRGINLSKIEQDEIKELTNKFWEKCTCRQSGYIQNSRSRTKKGEPQSGQTKSKKSELQMARVI